MRKFAIAALMLGSAGALSLVASAPALAQGFSINAPGIHVHVGHHRHWGPRYYDRYPGPAGGWGTWNGCPPNYTIQDGVCKPYRGY